LIYPLAVWAIAQTVFPFTANGSMVNGPDGKPVGSLLIAQPFTKDEYFWPRPSAASYDGSASASSTLAASNYMLRYRVAQTLGPIVKYKSGPKAGQLVAPDVRSMVPAGQLRRATAYRRAVGRCSQRSGNRMGDAPDPSHAKCISDWAAAHKAEVGGLDQNRIPALPNAATIGSRDRILRHFSKQYPGKFPSAVTTQLPNGKSQTVIQPVKDGSDIQANFFDMWRQEHADIALADVPWRYGYDFRLRPRSAYHDAKREYQLDRVAAKWATDTKHDPGQTRMEIQQILQADSFAPLDGLVRRENDQRAAGQPRIDQALRHTRKLSELEERSSGSESDGCWKDSMDSGRQAKKACCSNRATLR